MKVGMIKLLFLFLMISNSHGDHLPPSDYSLLFPSEPHYAAAIMENPGIPGDTTELTISMWVYQVSSEPLNTFISYAVNGSQDTISFYSYGDSLHLEMGYPNEAPVANIVKINEWVHYIVSWQSEDGLVQLYVNGELAHSEIHDNMQGHTWGENDGVLVLGQDQDSVGGGFDSEQTFRGEMTEVNIWNKILTREEVQKVYHSQYEGNIIAWSRTVWTLDGKIAVVKSSEKHAHRGNV